MAHPVRQCAVALNATRLSDWACVVILLSIYPSRVSASGGQPHPRSRVCSLHRMCKTAHAPLMVSASPQNLTPASPSRVRALLVQERDAHRLQRELVRASLLLCPRAAR